MKIQNSDELNFPYFLLSDVDTEKQELPILFRLKGHLSIAPYWLLFFIHGKYKISSEELLDRIIIERSPVEWTT